MERQKRQPRNFWQFPKAFRLTLRLTLAFSKRQQRQPI